MVRVLLVEDDEKLSDLIEEYLTSHGFEVDVESKGNKAIYRILNSTYTFVILDLTLPEIDGLKICKLIRHKFPGYILILTASRSTENHLEGLELGADDYLEKPIAPKILLAR